MEQAQHTPGEWVYDYDETDDSRCGYLVRKRNTNVPVAMVASANRDSQRERIARLIAAAPALLAALEKCVRELQRYENPQNIVTSLQLDALAAIAKAKGEQA